MPHEAKSVTCEAQKGIKMLVMGYIPSTRNNLLKPTFKDIKKLYLKSIL